MALMSESLLRTAWESQRFPGPLCTTDGRRIEVFEKGDLNFDEGPDVHDALIRIGGTLYRGDVELHIDARSWVSHGHERDAHYNSVILHVALQSPGHVTRTSSGRVVPLLILESSSVALSDANLPGYVPVLRCYDWNEMVPLPVIRRWLHTVGRERLARKTAGIIERLKELVQENRRALHEPGPSGEYHPSSFPAIEPPFCRTDFSSIAVWEQVFYEGVMECLGYSKNRSPMARLARTLMLDFLRRFPMDNPLTREAMLFGAAGLLDQRTGPDDEETKRYRAKLEEKWKSIRRSWPCSELHPAEWIFFRLRPVNFPTARLAVAAALISTLFEGRGLRRLFDIARSPQLTGKEYVRAYADLFETEPGDYWHSRCSFGPECGEGGAVLGGARIRDILVNVVVPFLLAFDAIFGDRKVRLAGLKLYAGLPLLQENSITRRMRTELVKDRFRICSAADQQALLQLHNAYCIRGRCQECGIGSIR